MTEAAPLRLPSLDSLAQNWRMTPATLYSRLDPMWVPKEFLLLASLKIAQAIARGNGRLIISWPPRHGKSRLATIATPIWVMENFPTKHIMLSSYGADLSTDFGREVRDLTIKHQDKLTVRIRQDVKRVAHFRNNKGGSMTSVGIGGPITGRGADVFLIDDYIKSVDEAANKSQRDFVWDWFRGTAYHRMEPGATMIIIATRWHSDDLIGRILKEWPGEWEYIKFSAEAMPGDILGRKEGEALFPERMDEKALRERRRVLGTYFYNAIFQQEPMDDEGKQSNKEWIEIIDHLPDFEASSYRFARIWDFGGGKGKKNDPSCGTLIAVNEETLDCTILDIWRKRVGPAVLEEKVKEIARLDGKNTKIIIEQEPGASGVQVVNHYQNHVLRGFKVESVLTTTGISKPARARPFLAAAEAGKVKALKRPWNDAFLDELDTFPDGDHDDQVDTCAIGYNDLTDYKPEQATWGRERPKIRNAVHEGRVRIIDGREFVVIANRDKVKHTSLTWGRR